jgi:hypothetical protein
MITRSKAKVLKAQAELNAPKRAPTSVVRTRMPQARQPSQLHASRLDQDQQQRQHAELEAALLAAAIQMAVDSNQTGTRVDQDPNNDDAAALETQVTIAACLDLMRTSFNIAVQVLRITLMACQVSNAVHQKNSIGLELHHGKGTELLARSVGHSGFRCLAAHVRRLVCASGPDPGVHRRESHCK